MGYPLLSIAVCCYNHERYIDDCMASVLAVSYPNKEIVVGDDCSTDSSFEKLKGYEERLKEKYRRVAIIQTPKNSGVVTNMNSIIRECHGEYIFDISCDDMMLPDGVTRMIAEMEDHPEYDIAYSNAYIVEDKDHFVLSEISGKRKVYSNIPPHGYGLGPELFKGNFICALTVMFRNRTFKKYGVFDTKYAAEDAPYWLRISRNGCIGYIDYVTCAYRKADGSLTNWAGPGGIERWEKAFSSSEQMRKDFADLGTDEGWEIFYNNSLLSAYIISNKPYIVHIKKAMKDRGLRIYPSVKMKIFLHKTRLYNAASSVVHLFTMRGKLDCR